MIRFTRGALFSIASARNAGRVSGVVSVGFAPKPTGEGRAGAQRGPPRGGKGLACGDATTSANVRRAAEAPAWGAALMNSLHGRGARADPITQQDFVLQVGKALSVHLEHDGRAKRRRVVDGSDCPERPRGLETSAWSLSEIHTRYAPPPSRASSSRTPEVSRHDVTKATFCFVGVRRARRRLSLAASQSSGYSRCTPWPEASSRTSERSFG